MEWPLHNKRALRAAARSFQAQSELTRSSQNPADIRGSSPQLVFSTALLLVTAGIALASWMSAPKLRNEKKNPSSPGFRRRVATHATTKRPTPELALAAIAKAPLLFIPHFGQATHFVCPSAGVFR